jgi:hypothetical protein
MKQFTHRRNLHELPRVHYRDTVAGLCDDPKIMSDEDDCGPGL